MKRIRLVLTLFIATMVTGLAVRPAQAGVPPPDPPLGPPPPAPIPLSGGPAWHETARWMLVGGGLVLTMLLVVAAVGFGTGRLRHGGVRVTAG